MGTLEGDAPDFLLDQEEEQLDDSVLARLQSLVKTYKERRDQVEMLQESLKRAEQAFNQVAQEEIPMLLRQYQLSEIRLESGDRVKVREEARVSVPSEKEQAFQAFLQKRGEEDIIKLHFAFGRMPVDKMKDLFVFLNDGEYDYSADRKVHPQTLKKYFKTLLGVGEEDREEGVREGRYLREQDVVDVANVFTFYNTIIK